MVKVFYVPEGYFTGVVKAQIGESEFMIHWDDGSTTSAVLRDEDETEDADNEDRWSIVEVIPYESISVPVNNDKTGNGARSKQITPQKPITPPPQPPQPATQPAAFEEEEDDNGHGNENEDNENDENDDNDNNET